MKFDGNLAWKQASAQVSANRDVLIALAGVFFLLPSLAFGLLMPQPPAQVGMTPEQMMTVARGYYLTALPFLIPVLLLQALGTLAMLTLFTDRRRPTVGESIRRGAIGLIPYFVSQIILGAVLALATMVITALAALSGLMAVVVAVVAVVLLAALYIGIRMSLVAPVIAVEHVRSPVSALLRSWRLTQGNAGRITLFYLLVGIAFAVIVSIITLLLGIVVALVAKGQATAIVSEVIRALLGAVLSVYVVAILAAVHRQIAGPAPETESMTFE